MKLAIIDLDGVVANNEARFAKAEEAKQAYLDEMAELQISDARGATDTFWHETFNPEHVPLDTLIEGACEALDTFQFTQGYHILFLTSRPETMRDATAEWCVLSQGQFLPQSIIR